MKFKLIAVAAVLVLASPMLICSGCQDAAASQRDTAQKELEGASRELQIAIASGDESRLNALISRLGSISGGSAEQQAAKSLLTATALREQAAVKLAQANPIINKHEIARSGASANLDAAQRLSALAASSQSIDVGDQRQTLQQELDAAARQAADLRKRAEQLDGPISQQTDQNTTASEEAQKLRAQVAELRRRAQELGHNEGFDVYKQSVAADREADRIEIGVAQREIDLQYSLRPDYSLATSQADHLEAAVQIILQTQSMLDSFASAAQADGGASRQAMTKLVSEVTATIDQLRSETESELNPLYDAAIAALDRAATTAENGARQMTGEATQAVRLLAARIRGDVARVHWSRARALDDLKTLLERLTASASALNVPARYADELKSVSEAHQQSVEQAQTAITASQELLSQVTGRGAEQVALDRYRTELEGAVAALSGRAAQAPAAAPASPDADAAGSAAAPAPPATFSTADELREYLNSLPESVDGLRSYLAMVKARTPDGQKFLRAQTTMLDGVAELDAAMTAQFNQSVFDDPALKASLASIPKLDPSNEVERADDKVVYEFTSPAVPGPQRAALVNVDGSWWLSGDEMTPQVRSMLAMMEQMAPQMRQVFTMLAQRVRSGEFKSANELQMALMQAMTSGAGAPGGAPGGPGAPAPGGTGPRR